MKECKLFRVLTVQQLNRIGKHHEVFELARRIRERFKAGATPLNCDNRVVFQRGHIYSCRFGISCGAFEGCLKELTAEDIYPENATYTDDGTCIQEK